MEIGRITSHLERLYLVDQREKRPRFSSTETEALRRAVEILNTLQNLIALVTYKDAPYDS